MAGQRKQPAGQCNTMMHNECVSRCRVVQYETISKHSEHTVDICILQVCCTRPKTTGRTLQLHLLVCFHSAVNMFFWSLMARKLWNQNAVAFLFELMLIFAYPQRTFGGMSWTSMISTTSAELYFLKASSRSRFFVYDHRATSGSAQHRPFITRTVYSCMYMMYD